MKSVLIAIQPKWCDLIAQLIKKIEVRKTRPKINVPFKCYIYCSEKDYDKIFCVDKFMHKAFLNGNGKQKVIGEFICDYITGLKADNMIQAYYNNTKETCLTDEEIMKYANGGKLYYWHISNLVIYETPKELTEFKTECREYGSDNPNCTECNYYINGMCYEYDESDCGCNGLKPITRPPQSWCYVEVLGV